MDARMPASNITMADLAEWWAHIQVEHKCELRCLWKMSGNDALAHWVFCVAVWKGAYAADVAPYTERVLSWPTASHKTVLGAIMWLLVGIDDDMTASRALTR
jgi:hypothetical protein